MTGPRVVPVWVVVPPHLLLLDLAGPVEVLRKAALVQDAVRFEVRYVGPNAQVGTSVGLTVCGIAPLPETLPEGSWLILPGTTTEPLGSAAGGADISGDADEAVIRWLRTVMGPGIRLVTICSGALLAARAGLLNGVACTTHHACIDELRRLAPAARVLDNRLFVEDGDRLSSAGVTAGIDLILHMVAELAGPACAVEVARYLVVYLRRAGGDPQMSPWLQGRNHVHPVIHRVQDAIVADPARDWSVPALAGLAATSPRSLSRLFNEHAGMSVTDFVNRVRIALARDVLEHSRLSMEMVAEKAGFASSRQFRRVWARLDPHPPRDTRRRAAGGPD